MSQKWRRSQAWDDRHIPAWAWPLKAALRLFSSVWFGIWLLVLVGIYGILASVPIGLLAKAPTMLVYAATVVAAIALVAGLPTLAAWKALKGRSRATRFVACFASFVVLAIAAVWLWQRYAWPRLHHDPATNSGLLFFADFVERYKSVTVRRLPGMEMSELEFYSWWPLRTILLLFVANMLIATLRRIEFDLKRLGVLTVHTGIITIALGSILYSRLKVEGDTLLLAGEANQQTAVPTPGPAQSNFFDNTRVALHVEQRGWWEQRPLEGVPRYNDYNLAAITGEAASTPARMKGGWLDADKQRPLSLAVPPGGGAVDEDIRFRVVGYASYAEPKQDWVRVPDADIPGLAEGQRLNPLRLCYLHSALADEHGSVSDDPVFAMTFLPGSPARRIGANDALAVEYTLGPTLGMSDARWRDLTERVPPSTAHALAVDVPASPGRSAFRAVYPIRAGESIAIGETGYSIDVKQISQKPPFPIITEGYRGASSSVAVLTIRPPAAPSFDRFVYHRFPEISQDLLQETNERGMPKRRDADPAIRVSLIECDRLSIYFDEPRPGTLRAIVRQPGGDVRVVESIPLEGGGAGWLRDFVPKLSVRVAERWTHARSAERPEPVDPLKRDNRLVGTHDQAMLAVEVSVRGAKGSTPASERQATNQATQIVWLPFTKYTGLGMGTERSVELLDGRKVTLAFGRRRHVFPNFELQLVDFQMIAYDHRGAPRDYQSILRVTPGDDSFEMYEHVAKLNEPLTAPFRWDDHRSWAGNFFGRLRSGLSPNQFKLSQAGWDRSGWEESQRLVDLGQAQRPLAQFTILQVGNNPGIHVIALGGILMGLGIPWAFYVKPWLVRREKKKIQAQVAAGTYVKPAPKAKQREMAGMGATE